MIWLLALALSGDAESKFAACVAQIDVDPAAAIEFATKWRFEQGGVPARQCLGLAYAAEQRFAAAAAVFEAAARDSEASRDGRAPRLWVQAGNASLAAGNAAKARDQIDAALAGGTLGGAAAGEAHLDRARAFVALSQTKAARGDIDQALALVPADPLAWLLSATLARRMGDLVRAASDIAEAARRSPDDGSVALEAGNIAYLSGSASAARTAWQAAVAIAPASEAGKSAAASLLQLGAAPTR